MARPTPASLKALALRDPRLGSALLELPRFPGFPDEANAREPSHWNALARAIVFQQLATAAATTIHRRVCALTPGEGFPTHAEFLALDDAALRSAGLSRNKIDALRDLAARVDDGRLALHDLHEAEDEVVIERLVAVRGIGEWSAHMFLLFRLGRLDVGAAGDLGVREGLRLLDGAAERPTPKAALARMEAWRPLRSVGSWLMWRLVDRERARERPAEKDLARGARAEKARAESSRAGKSREREAHAVSSRAKEARAEKSGASARRRPDSTAKPSLARRSTARRSAPLSSRPSGSASREATPRSATSQRGTAKPVGKKSTRPTAAPARAQPRVSAQPSQAAGSRARAGTRRPRG